MNGHLPDAIAAVIAESAFSGVVRVDRVGHEHVVMAAGWADRANEIENTPQTRFATASGTKGLTALAMMRLVELGVVGLDTTARSLLGPDLPLIDDGVTVAHLLTHRSGIGDYLDEETLGDITDYIMRRPVHELAETEAFVPLLDGLPTVSPPGERFAYNNGAFVVLALLMERATGEGYHRLVERLVIEPGRLAETAFLRTDELPGGVALGYLHATGLRTNIFHLPVRGNGDGGVFTTAADVARLWEALFDGSIVQASTAAAMTRPTSVVPEEDSRYGIGFWLHPDTDAVRLIGSDAGVSFRSVHAPAAGITHTVISNVSNGAWTVSSELDSLLGV